jgi:crotonobetainyl-CoA:carnitine CoA-transferase CaiB-like acyl-CoA transferase
VVAPARFPSDLDGAALLGERAALLGLRRLGATSPGGSCRLLRSADAWIALNLARTEDIEALPAWLETDPVGNLWNWIEDRTRRATTDALVGRARLLGLPVAPVAAPDARPIDWLRVASRVAPGPPPRPDARPLVVDLSALWAGPLCTHLLSLAGARVVKLESRERPDGARLGHPSFFSLLNAGKRSAALDFGDRGDRARLRALLLAADIVVESARPRALAQLGIDAGELLERRPGLTWLSITGYGRQEPAANWVAFGDDAAAAAGLAAATGGIRQPLFCGDAIADPLTGIHAALAALASWRRGGGELLDLALRRVVAHVLAFEAEEARARVWRRSGNASGRVWLAEVAGQREVVQPPRARSISQPAPALGSDTAAVLQELAIPC